MKSDRPIGSVTDRDGWDWNKRQAERRSDGSSGEPSDYRRDGSQRRAHPERDATSEREIERLEAELERTEERLQSVIDRYERLLKRKNRQLNDLTRSASKPEEQSTKISKVCQYFTDC